MNEPSKRKLDSDNSISNKRTKITSSSRDSAVTAITEKRQPSNDNVNQKDNYTLALTKSSQPVSKVARKRRINKLMPPRPFPIVPTSVSATGPRSAHTEGKNFICVTRKLSLGAYMRRCKNVILKDGYKTLYFSAMGAAIPLVLQLVVALPPILPFSFDEIRTEVKTGTTEVRDEVIPDDDDDDLSYEVRCKSTLSVVFKIGNGELDGNESNSVNKSSKNREFNGGVGGNHGDSGNRPKTARTQLTDLVLQEPEQEML